MINFRKQPTMHPMRAKSRCEVAALLGPLLSSPARVTGCRHGAERLSDVATPPTGGGIR